MIFLKLKEGIQIYKMKIFVYLMLLVNLSLTIFYFKQIKLFFEPTIKLEATSKIINQVKFISLPENTINNYIENKQCVDIDIFEDTAYAHKIIDYLKLFNLQFEIYELTQSYPLYEIFTYPKNNKEAQKILNKLTTLNIRAIYDKKERIISIAGQMLSKKKIDLIREKVKKINIRTVLKDTFYARLYYKIKIKNISALKFISNNFKDKLNKGFNQQGNIKIELQSMVC